MPYAIVQTKDAFNNSATSVSTGNFTTNPTAGNLIYVVAQGFTAATAFNTPTDTLGNTYVALGNATEAGTGTFLYHWYAKNIAGGAANSITVTSTGTATVLGIAAAEISGLDTVSPFDVQSIQGAQVGASGANAMTSGSATNTVQPAVIIGFQSDLQGAAEAAGTSPIAFTGISGLWNNIGGSGVANAMFEHARLTTTGSVAATFQDTGFDRYLASMAVFREVPTQPSVTLNGVNTTKRKLAQTDDSDWITLTTWFDSSTTNVRTWFDEEFTSYTAGGGGGTTFLSLGYSATGTVTRQSQVSLSRAYSGTGTETLQRQVNKFTTYSGTGTSTVQKQVSKFFSYGATGTSTLVQLLVKLLSFAYNATGTSTVQKQINKFLAYTATGANALQKQINKSLAYNGTGTSAVQKQVNKFLGYAATGTLATTFLLVKLLAFTYTATGTVSLALLAVIGRAFSYTATGTSTVQKQIGKSFGYVATGTSAVVKQVQKFFSYNGTGTLTFVRAATMAKAFVYSAIGTLTFTKTFFGGGGPVVQTIRKTFKMLYNRFGRW